MIKTIFILLTFLLLPSIADAANGVFSTFGAEPAEAFSDNQREYLPGEMSDDVSDMIKLISAFKLKKIIPGSGRLIQGPPVQFTRPAKDLSPHKTILGRFPSVFPTTVLRI
ncbi:MAG: hypothetical protein JW913_09675 [Chitinispirillaceae bacterium]|nr:hypothetical protein [Chitinispirillaceae bacterium]